MMNYIMIIKEFLQKITRETLQLFTIQLRKFKQAVSIFTMINLKERLIFLSSVFVPVLFAFSWIVWIPVLTLPATDNIYTDMSGTKNQLSVHKPDKLSVVKNSPSPDEFAELVEKMHALKLEENFLKSVIRLALEDSITLTIDLVDSTMHLKIKGVTVRKCRLTDFTVSNAFRKIPVEKQLKWTSWPFTLQEYGTTSAKIPIVLKKAPRDTIEAIRMATEPVVPKKDDVFYILKFDRHLIVGVEQNEPATVSGNLEKMLLRLRWQIKIAAEAFWRMVRFQFSVHDLWITIKVSRDDARAVNRALPDNAKMVLRLPSYANL